MHASAPFAVIAWANYERDGRISIWEYLKQRSSASFGLNNLSAEMWAVNKQIARHFGQTTVWPLSCPLPSAAAG